LAFSALAYIFWRYVRRRHSRNDRSRNLLLVTYVASRLGLWLAFSIFLQHHVTTSDPRENYTPILEHLLAAAVPIRDFYYPYGPFLFPSILPSYLLLGRSLAGISLFAILAEALALAFFVKSTSLLERRGEISHLWVREALALYLLNPSTLYWTVFHGYHSIVQTAYSMGALYFLLRGNHAIGYAIGFFGVAGSKILAVLDWPALLTVCRPRLAKAFQGALPLLLIYAIFHVVTGNFHASITSALFLHAEGPRNFYPFSEGNVWHLLTLFGDLRAFYATFPGKLLPLLSFGICFVLGFGYWLRCQRRGLASFSFQAAMGMTTFTMSLFFLFSFYTGNYYVPMLMLPASLVVTCPTFPDQRAAWSMVLISGLCVTGDAIWTALGQAVLIDAVTSDSLRERLLAGLWTAGIVVRIACFLTLATFGLRMATLPLRSGQAPLRSC
jgi:hypothetical protein